MGSNVSKEDSRDNFLVEGYVSQEYESVRDLFEEGFKAGREQSAQLCVYVGDEMVVNLWHSISNPAYTKDTLTNIFSSSKNMTSVAMLHDKGLLHYDAKIVEFSGDGKEGITVSGLLRNEAGFANFPVEFDSKELLLTENIKNNSIGEVYEEALSRFPYKGKREYHGLIRGSLANELFRRIEHHWRVPEERVSIE